MTRSPCICTNLRQAAHRVTDIYDRALAPAGLKVTMYRLLKTVRDTPEQSLSQLAARLEIDRSTLGRNLGVLERRGLVSRVGQKDARARCVALTTAGKAALDRAEPLWQAAQDDIAGRLDGRSDDLFRLLDLTAPAPGDTA